MSKNKNSVFSLLPIIAGCFLLCFCALFLTARVVVKNQTRERLPLYTQSIENLLPERSLGIIETRSENIMPALEINGENFVGLLEMTEFDVKLPVFSEWDNKNIGKLPALYLGSIYDGSIVIGGDFDFADTLNCGEHVSFTDMSGQVFNFSVSAIKHADKLKEDILKSDESDLTLFTKSNGAYLIIRCTVSP